MCVKQFRIASIHLCSWNKFIWCHLGKLLFDFFYIVRRWSDGITARITAIIGHNAFWDYDFIKGLSLIWECVTRTSTICYRRVCRFIGCLCGFGLGLCLDLFANVDALVGIDARSVALNVECCRSDGLVGVGVYLENHGCGGVWGNFRRRRRVIWYGWICVVYNCCGLTIGGLFWCGIVFEADRNADRCGWGFAAGWGFNFFDPEEGVGTSSFFINLQFTGNWPFFSRWCKFSTIYF